jgi:hypothetical protein
MKITASLGLSIFAATKRLSQAVYEGQSTTVSMPTVDTEADRLRSDSIDRALGGKIAVMAATVRL